MRHGGKLHGGNARLAGANPAMGAVGSEARQGQFFSEAIYYARGADGRFANGLTAVAWELEDTTCNGGGFGCLAGSHRMDTPPPAALSAHTESGVVSPSIQRVPAAAGDCIIFTEALLHCTLPWTSRPKTRTTLFYKYTAIGEHYSTHISLDYTEPIREALAYPDVGARAAAILWHPSVGGRPSADASARPVARL
jgi:hypothetical protein